VKDSVKQAYSDWASTYDDELNCSIELEQPPVVNLLQPRKGDIILDVGCGTGRYSYIATKLGAEVIGIDFSSRMLAIAKKKVPKAKFARCDITKPLYFPDKTFDKIICGLVIDHLKNITPLFQELSRVLKDKGYMIITTLHPRIDFEGIEHINMHFPLSSYKCTVLHSFRELRTAAKDAGLNISIVELKIDESIKHCFTPESFKKIKGRFWGVILVLTKK
jgi:malonyl-CoA O-methyltransferase